MRNAIIPFVMLCTMDDFYPHFIIKENMVTVFDFSDLKGCGCLSMTVPVRDLIDSGCSLEFGHLERDNKVMLSKDARDAYFNMLEKK